MVLGSWLHGMAEKILQVEENELRQAKTNILSGCGQQKSHLQPKCNQRKVKEERT